MFAEKNNSPAAQPIVHTITLKDETIGAVDATFDMIDAVYQNVAEDAFVRFLYDASDVHHMPVKYALDQYKQYSFRNPRHRNSRMAVLLRPHLFMLAISSLGDGNRHALRMTDNVRFYPADRAEEARKWLLS